MNRATALHLRDVQDSTITAISLRGSQVTVQLEVIPRVVRVICTNAVIFGASMDCVSILRLAAHDRRIARIQTLTVEQDTLLVFTLAGGVCLAIHAEAIVLR